MTCYGKIIPSPKFFNIISYTAFAHDLTIGGSFKDAIDVFKSYAQKALKIDFSEGNDFNVCLDESLEKGEYTITSTEGKVEISAGGDEGANYALATLLLLMEIKEEKAFLPCFEMRDKADNDYRGLMIDCARNVHPLPLLKKYIDLCWFYKIKYLHLHFTDDQAYTLPSKVLPHATSEHNHYTEAEITELANYAHERSVQIVPEIDAPGHSKAIIAAYPHLCESEGKGLIGFYPEAIKKMQELYRELCNMFPYSEYIHIGADESDIMDWNKCEKSVQHGRELGIKKEEILPYFWPDWHTVERYFAHFINKMAEAIVGMGRKPVVWEGFTKEVNEYITRDVTVMVFENFYQTPASLIKNGFDIINCSWRPTYVVVPKYHWDKDECYKWDVGTFSAVHPDSPYYNGYFVLESHKNIKGGQLNAWGDFLGNMENGLEVEFDALRDRLPAVAESTWNDKKQGDYADFLHRHKHCAEIFDRILNDAQ